MNKKTGGPAFPCETLGVDEHGSYRKPYEGMTLRDYFAAKAMQLFIHREEWQSTVGNVSEEVAFNAYAMADAMMEERRR